MLATDEEARDAAALARLLETHSIGHVMAVPGLIQAVAIAAPGVISGRDRVLSTGEPLFPGTAGAIHDTAPGVPLYNSYGCTETTGDVAAGPVSAGDAQNGIVPIGTPLPGSFCHVLGPDLVPVPPGVLGEIYVGGPQLARGYLAQPALTAARFVASPFEAGGRLYRTGDLARWRDDGRLELAGRSDDQVNVRGHRVEPAEAVEALHALPNVREAAVLPRAVGTTTELVAYVAGDGLGPDDGPQLRQQLARTLPGPLVPAEVVVLPHLPRLNGGKIDRQALLRRPATPRAPATDTPPPPKPPQNDREAALAGILCAVLGRPSVGMDDDFFALGGDSLLAVSFAARAHAAGMSFPAAAVFQYPTIAQLVRQLPPPREEKAVALTLPPQTHRFRLSGLPVQDFVSWEALRGPVDTDRLRRALTETIARHAPLRQAISTRGRLWRATQAPATNGDAMVIEIGNADAGRALEIAAQAIDIAAGRVIVALVTADAALLAAHPTVIDGLSLARIAGEIDGQTQDPPPPQPAGQAAATPPAHWDAVLGAGPESPWWVGPDDPPPASPHARARAVTDTTDASILAGTLLRAVRTLSGREAAVADVEVDPELVGPLVAVPVISQTGREMIIGDAAAYTAYLSNRRPVAGGPGILIRRTVAPEPWQAGGIARGADRLYHIVASWQRLGGRTVLEVAAHEPGVAEALAATWAEALSGRERAHG
ncbi:MAG: AMP-binding protein [Azospirillaceae bacterium]|nr:AMP-binding protein [Azospirillaceae bacterium]